MSVSTFEEVTKKEPEKSLLEPVKRSGGRNNNGRITTRHRGGGHKRRYRVVDFKRLKDGVRRRCRGRVRPEPVGPHRAAALRRRRQGLHPAPARLMCGATVESGPAADIKPGNALPLENIPNGPLIKRRAEARPGGKIAPARPARACSW